MDIEVCLCPCGCRNQIIEPSVYGQTPYAITAGWYVRGPLCDGCISQNHQFQIPQREDDEDTPAISQSEYDNDDALTILKKRFAKGEISIEEFMVGKKALLD